MIRQSGTDSAKGTYVQNVKRLGHVYSLAIGQPRTHGHVIIVCGQVIMSSVVFCIVHRQVNVFLQHCGGRSGEKCADLYILERYKFDSDSNMVIWCWFSYHHKTDLTDGKLLTVWYRGWILTYYIINCHFRGLALRLFYMQIMQNLKGLTMSPIYFARTMMYG